MSEPDAERLQRQIAELLRQLAALQAGSATATDHSVAGGPDSVNVGGDVHGGVIDGDENIQAGGHVIFAERGATVVIGEAPVSMTAVDRDSALGKYLHHVISRNRYLQLQGIRSKGRLVHIELDQIYVTLRTTSQRERTAELEWLEEEARQAPGERKAPPESSRGAVETMTVSVNEALQDHARLVVVGDPGSGKTTLLRYMALAYASDLAGRSGLVQERLGLSESGHLPLLLPLRQIASYLKSRNEVEDGTEGFGILLDFIGSVLGQERIHLPERFFDKWLEGGRAVVLLDGLDEIADLALRRRVSRLVAAFTRAYPHCRYVVTSRIVGYTGAARLGEDYVAATVRDFSLADVERFLRSWHRLVAIGHMGPGESAEAYAEAQTSHLMQAIRGNERIRELAINPLMLTVIAMVHRDGVQLPDRRAELYAEAVDVLLGKWGEAHGVQETPVLGDKPFDAGDKRLMLQGVALHMHEHQQKEIEAEPLTALLAGMFTDILGERRAAERAVERFLDVIQERTGLLVARGEGVFAFSHLTFQEYLAALAVAAKDDYIAYTLQRCSDPWWREVILLAAGYLSTQSRQRTTSLIQAIADLWEEPQPYHNLVLASHCLRDVGSNRAGSELAAAIQQRLKAGLEEGEPVTVRFLPRTLRRSLGVKNWIERRSAAMQALVLAGGGLWTPPYGEPEWIAIPAGPFRMGSDPQRDSRSISSEQPQHQLTLPAYAISRVPITNAQYLLFTQSTGHPAPQHWQDESPQRGYESHPVVNVSWHDAVAYCRWLSEVTGKLVTLPSEAQWEKAARGHKDKRIYPWGDEFEATRSNNFVLGLGGTTPVGIFAEGASPYGCMDMAGNVWEWTRSLWGKDWSEPDFKYRYDPHDGRENLNAPDFVRRVVRGGSWHVDDYDVRCAARYWFYPYYRYDFIGFRVVCSPYTFDL